MGHDVKSNLEAALCTPQLPTLSVEEFMLISKNNNRDEKKKKKHAGIQSLFHFSNAVVMFTSVMQQHG